MLIGLIIAVVVVVVVVVVVCVIVAKNNKGTDTVGGGGKSGGSSGSGESSGSGATTTKPTGTGSAKVEKEEASASIVSIGILDENNNLVSGTSKQFVNLPKEQKYVEGTVIKHTGVLSQKLKCKVKFNRSGSHKFKVKLLPDTNNTVYTDSEKSHNANFKYQEDTLEFTTDSNGEKIIEDNNLFVSPAGGDKFKLSAWATDDVNKTVQSVEIQNERIMYYVEVKMTGLTTCANSLNVFINEYIKHGITFQGLPEESMPYMENIGANDGNTFKSNVQSAYNASQGPDKNPYCIAVAYTDHLAVKDANEEIPCTNVQGGASAPVNISIQDGSGKQYALWHNIVTTEDWFVECYFVKNGGTVATDKVAILKDKCTPVQTPGYPTGYFGNVNIDVSGLPSEIGTITLKINRVNRMRAGLSFGGTNIVAICTKAWWQVITTQNQNEVIVHEVGHQFKMVVDGSGILPEKTANFYDSTKGHVGSHCHTGIPAGQARYDSQADLTLSLCVMYGATNNHSDFCSDCAIAVKKIDLSNGV